MKHLGDFDTSAVIYGKFTTFRPSTGAAFTLGGTPALSVYKDNSTTQSTTGVTLTADFDAVTGLNHFAIDTSADGTFYSAGSFFDIVITTGTVDSVSVVGAVVGGFTIRKNSALKPATAGRTLVVDASGLADANMVKMGPTGSGTAQTARDIGASVLLSAGTSTGQLDFTSGVVKANITQIGGSAVSTSTAQIGVNVVNFGGSAGTFASGRPEVNTTHAAGTAWNSGAIGANTLATDTITNSKIAADAIGASELAADAVAEIQSGLSTYAGGDTSGTTTLLSRLSALRAGYLDNINNSALASTVAQTGDAYAIVNSGTFGNAAIKGYVDDIGVAGAGLTALGDTRLANLDAAVSSRMATYAQPAGFLAATFPTTVASTTNITTVGAVSGSVGSVTAQVSADVTAISGDATAADNLESYLDGTNFMPVDAHKPIFSISGATLTVKKPDGSTTAYTRTLATDAAAEPVIGSS